MFASNFHVNSAISNSDGIDSTGPNVRELYQHFASWVADLPAEDQARLFAGTAEEVYRI